MDIIVVQMLPFAMLQPGMPLRIEVKNAIDVEPLNLQNYHTILARLELGLKISGMLDGYWGKDEKGYVRRLASLGRGQELVISGSHLDYSIDLRTMKLDEVRDFHQMLIGFRLTSKQQVLP